MKRYVTKLEKKPSRLRLACFALKVFKRMAFEWFEMISQKVCDEIVKGTNKVFFSDANFLPDDISYNRSFV